MLKKFVPKQDEIETVSPEHLVPKNHLVRKIAKAIDFEFIREEVSHLYCHNNGRPPVDPVQLFKIMFLGFIFGVKSERQLVKEIEVNVAYRWFLGMSLTDKVIHSTTLSQNRIRRFNGTDVFERIFIRIVEQAMKKGLVGGDKLFTDSTHLKASANKNKYRNENLKQKTSAYIEMLNEDIEKDRLKEGKKPLKKHDVVLKEKNTKVSTTDPQSGFMTRDNKPKGFFYLDHRTVDGKHGIILDTFATAGNVHDAQPYINQLDIILARFKLSPIAVGLDAGYFTATVAESLERRNIIGVFGYRRPHRTKNAFKKKHFIYDKSTDSYLCPNGQELIYKTTSREGYRQYHSDAKKCKVCPVREKCTQSQNYTKVIARHIYTDAVDKANEVRLSTFGKKIYRRRSETVERSFADAKQHHNHRYARYRSLAKVQMQCLLAAIAQNIKKIALLFSIYISLILNNILVESILNKLEIYQHKHKEILFAA